MCHLRRESVDYDRMQDSALVRGIIKDRRSARRVIYDVKVPITTECGNLRRFMV